MDYGNYKTLRQAIERLGLEETDENLFPNIQPVEPSAWLVQTLAMGKIMPLTNEKSKSERLISPILMEVAVQYRSQITLYSGEEMTVDEKQDLSGYCDFFLAKHPRKEVMQAPIIALAEAKDEDMDYGKGQCAAQMYAAHLFNEQRNKTQPFVYGCAVTGGEWKFLKLVDKQLFVDEETYYITNLDKILGILHHIVKLYL